MRGYQRGCLSILCAIAFSACLLPDAVWQVETGELQSRGRAGASGAAPPSESEERAGGGAAGRVSSSPAEGADPAPPLVPPPATGAGGSRSSADGQSSSDAGVSTAGPDAASAEPDPPSPEVRCNELQGVLQPGTRDCFLIVGEARVSWDAAEQSCLSRGARLATVETVARDQFITSLIDSEVWIGASDAALDGQFVWIDGSPLTFSGWGPGEPNGGPGVDCVLKTAAGGWSDRRCTDLAALVCVLQL